jgi:hypothetical protein
MAFWSRKHLNEESMSSPPLSSKKKNRKAFSECLFDQKYHNDQTMSAPLHRLFKIVEGWFYVCLNQNSNSKETCVLKHAEIDHINPLSGPLRVYINIVFLVSVVFYTPPCFFYSKNKTQATLCVFVPKLNVRDIMSAVPQTQQKLCLMSCPGLSFQNEKYYRAMLVC